MPPTLPQASRGGAKKPALVEYLRFEAGDNAREYRLMVRHGDDSWGVTVAIPNEAFLSGRARYQDAPDICFLKIQKELAASGEDGLIARDHQMTDQELEEYKVSHTPKKPQRRGG